MAGPVCEATVDLDAGALNDGDHAGLCALIGDYGLVAVMREDGQFYLVMKARDAGRPKNRQDAGPGLEHARVPLKDRAVSLRIVADFRDGRDEIRFFHSAGGAFEPIGPAHRPDYDLIHFAGCRFGLFAYSTRRTGGAAKFDRFRYRVLEDNPG